MNHAAVPKNSIKVTGEKNDIMKILRNNTKILKQKILIKKI